jgi:hypothetical protein
MNNLIVTNWRSYINDLKSADGDHEFYFKIQFLLPLDQCLFIFVN